MSECLCQLYHSLIKYHSNAHSNTNQRSNTGTAERLNRIKYEGVRGTGLTFAHDTLQALEELHEMLKVRVENIEDESVLGDRSEMSLIAIVGSSLEKIPGFRNFVKQRLTEEGISCT